MKNYISRLKENCSTRTFVFWWIFRLLMVYAFVVGFFKKPFDITDPLQVGANLLCMFLWEIFMLFPEKSTFRYVTPGFQTVFIPGIFAASFGGKFLNLYYDSRFLDSFLHAWGSMVCVFFGYELICAIMKKERKPASLTVIIFASVGFSFMCSTLWELFEFAFDQFACMTGGIGDAQHWSRGLAEGTPKIATLFDPVFDGTNTVALPGGEIINPGDRWPIMDIMGDMFLNVIGALAGFIGLKVYPYRHKGKNKIEIFEDEKLVTVTQ